MHSCTLNTLHLHDKHSSWRSLMQRWKALPPFFPTPYQRLSGSHASMSGWRAYYCLLLFGTDYYCLLLFLSTVYVPFATYCSPVLLAANFCLPLSTHYSVHTSDNVLLSVYYSTICGRHALLSSYFFSLQVEGSSGTTDALSPATKPSTRNHRYDTCV